MSLLPPLVLELRAHASQVYSELGGVEAAVTKMETATAGSTTAMQGAFNRTAAAGKILGAGLVLAAGAIGVESTKMASDFEESTTKLVTGAGESEKNLEDVKNGLLALAPAVGIGPKALSDAMFMVESAGYHGADGLKVMQAAAEGSKIGGADATVVANGLTTALTDYNLGAEKSADVTSMLVATVAAGKTNMGDLSGALSAVAPQAAAAGIGLGQLLGAMGTMTGQGISAQQSAQDLSSTIAALGNPTSVQTKAMAQMGLSSLDVASNMGKKGLTGTLDDLSTAVLSKMGPSGLILASSFNQSKIAAASAKTELDNLPESLKTLGQGYLDGTVTQKEWAAQTKTLPALQQSLAKQFATTAKEASGFSDKLKAGGGDASTFNGMMADMTGGQTGLAVSLALTGSHAETFNQNVKDISGSAADAQGNVKNWGLTQKDFATQMAEAKAGVEAMGVKIGTGLIPVIQNAVTIGAGFVDFLQQNPPLLYTLAGVIGGVLVLAIGAYIGQLVAAGVMSLIQFGKMIGAGAVWVATTVAQLAVQATAWVINGAKAAGSFVATNAAMLIQKGLVIGGAVVMGIATAAQWLWNVAMDANPIGLLIIAIAALVAGIIWVATQTTIFQDMWKAMTDFAVGVWTGFVSFATDSFNNLWDGLRIIGDGISSWWSSLWSGFGGMVGDAFNGVVDFVRGIFNGVIDLVNGILGKINGVLAAGSVIGINIQLPTLPHFDVGADRVPGADGAPMPAVIHGGESILSTDMLAGRKAIPARVVAAVAAQRGSQSTASSSTSSGSTTVKVYAQTNADPHRIAAEVGWVLRSMG